MASFYWQGSVEEQQQEVPRPSGTPALTMRPGIGDQCERLRVRTTAWLLVRVATLWSQTTGCLQPA